MILRLIDMTQRVLHRYQ